MRKLLLPFGFFVFIMSGLALAGCSGDILPTANPGSNIFGECPPPCWIDLEPGITDRSQAQTILETRYGSDSVKSDANSLYWSSGRVDRSEGGSLRFDDDTISEIDVRFREAQLQVRELIEVWGEPDSVQVVPTADGINCAGMSLIYFKLETEVVLFPSRSSLDIDSLQSVQLLVFSAPGSTVMPPTDTFLVDWQGYQDYCISQP